jgi:hypothetical protein
MQTEYCEGGKHGNLLFLLNYLVDFIETLGTLQSWVDSSADPTEVQLLTVLRHAALVYFSIASHLY